MTGRGTSPAALHEMGMARAVIQALNRTGVAVLYQDRDLRVLWARNTPACWSIADISGLTDTDFLPEGEAGRCISAKQSVLRTANPASLEIQVRDGDDIRWFDLWIDADRQPDGSVTGLVTTALETTDHKRREQTLRTLLREVSHRTKNLLAIIQSIATQTGRYSPTIDTFLTRFRGRLQSLASSQDLVTSSNWRGADLRELAFGQVGRYCAEPARCISVEGVNPYLSPNAALHIGLALHELAVNSVSYGALARADGAVRISAEPADDDGRQGLSLKWSETLPALGLESSEKRFGSVALERIVPASLDGSAQLDISDGSVVYRLFVPEGNFGAD